MAKYMIFIYDDEAQLSSAGADTIQSILQGHEKFAARHGAALRGGGRLGPAADAVTVPAGANGSPAQSRAGLFLSDAKHRIGGYYIVEADDIDQAVDMARDVPASYGGVEVRELV
jgi:hypothetical protein